jgi:hypothetical protein
LALLFVASTRANSFLFVKKYKNNKNYFPQSFSPVVHTDVLGYALIGHTRQAYVVIHFSHTNSTHSLLLVAFVGSLCAALCGASAVVAAAKVDYFSRGTTHGENIGESTH